MAEAGVYYHVGAARSRVLLALVRFLTSGVGLSGQMKCHPRSWQGSSGQLSTYAALLYVCCRCGVGAGAL